MMSDIIQNNPDKLTEKVKIINKLGLHARASAKMVDIAKKFPDTNIEIAYRDNTANCKSIMGVMMLAASNNAEIELLAQGEHAQAALAAIVSLINDRFGEGE